MAGSWWRRLTRSTATINPQDWQAAIAGLPWARGLPAQRMQTLYVLAGNFLRSKTITPLAGLTLDTHARLQLAALCCLPLLEFGREGLHGWSQLLVYPDAFRTSRSHMDAAGVIHQWDSDLIGEAWEQGPLILSWADVLADIAEPDAGYCVAVHEMAHKLDALDGLLDGTPALPRAWQRQWAEDFQRCYDRFCADLDRGVEPAIDPYAAESPEEFFAVVSEYHFSAPALLADGMAAVAGHLTRLYGPSPQLSSDSTTPAA